MERWVGLVILLLLIGSFITWKDIPKHKNLETAEIFSLALADGALVGWASKIAVWWFYPDSGISKEQAERAYVEAMNYGERYNPDAIMWGLLIGAFISIGGVIAVWMAKSASGLGQAFKMGFFAEIGEAFVYHIGYAATMGRSALSNEEVMITLVVAVIMGFIAIGVNSTHKRG